MKILNLYAGIGGNRKLWRDEHEITAIEWNEEIAKIYKEYFPNDIVIVEDAHQYLLKHIQEFDFIWSSPPCPTHSEFRKMSVYRGQVPLDYPDLSLYQEIVTLRYFNKKTGGWIVENVDPYYKPWVMPSVKLGRHLFWCNFHVRNRGFKKADEKIEHVVDKSTRFEFNLKKYDIKNKTQILRNIIDPEIGLYLLNEFEKRPKPFFNWNY